MGTILMSPMLIACILRNYKLIFKVNKLFYIPTSNAFPLLFHIHENIVILFLFFIYVIMQVINLCFCDCYLINFNS